MDHTDQVDRLASDGRILTLYFDSFRRSRGVQADSDFSHRTDRNGNIRLGWRESGRAHGHAVSTRKKVIHAKLATIFAFCLASSMRIDRLHHDDSRGNTGARCVLYCAPERAFGVLRLQNRHKQRRRQNEKFAEQDFRLSN